MGKNRQNGPKIGRHKSLPLSRPTFLPKMPGFSTKNRNINGLLELKKIVTYRGKKNHLKNRYI